MINKKIISSISETPSGVVTFIMLVNTTNYVPTGIVVRAQISATIFTGQAEYEFLKEVAEDPNVVSITISKAV